MEVCMEKVLEGGERRKGELAECGEESVGGEGGGMGKKYKKERNGTEREGERRERKREREKEVYG